MRQSDSFFKSSLGSKYVMAITGAMLYGFLIAHLLGNILVFSGSPAAINDYAEGLRNLPYGLLWILRGGLLVIFFLHVTTAIRLTKQNRQARPVPYAKQATIQASLSSRYMALTGILLLAFIAYHLAHFTFLAVFDTGPHLDTIGRPDVYTMVVEGFRQPLVALSYIVAMIVLGFHLSHGISSLCQSLGLNHPKYNKAIRSIGPVLGWAVSGLNILIPVSIWFGFVG